MTVGRPDGPSLVVLSCRVQADTNAVESAANFTRDDSSVHASSVAPPFQLEHVDHVYRIKGWPFARNSYSMFHDTDRVDERSLLT